MKDFGNSQFVMICLIVPGGTWTFKFLFLNSFRNLVFRTSCGIEFHSLITHCMKLIYFEKLYAFSQKEIHSKRGNFKERSNIFHKINNLAGKKKQKNFCAHETQSFCLFVYFLPHTLSSLITSNVNLTLCFYLHHWSFLTAMLPCLLASDILYFWCLCHGSSTEE